MSAYYSRPTMNVNPYARLNTFHGPKRQLLGNHAGHAAPAWKNVPAQGPSSAGKGKQTQLDPGSKIFLSRLPSDVKDSEVEELFRKTIGPLRECFLVYNSQGNSKGMAVVSFARPSDAMLAKQKYDGKVVDGSKPPIMMGITMILRQSFFTSGRPLKIELITEGTQLYGAQTGPPPTPSLLNRIGNPAKTQPSAANGVTSTIFPHAQKARSQMQIVPPPNAAIPVPPRRIRQKKGPKRIKKRAAITIDQLDKEMEDYRAAADMSGLTGI
ncbi:hypothetical protein H2248_003916 [Termitomyces sp. 'cryptogamus']|nr:hypothetical protein H2248_003916 [Termitomyces sp. 'cryptogamus']